MTPELTAAIVTVLTAVIVRLVDHYFPHLIDEARQQDSQKPAQDGPADTDPTQGP